MKVCFTQQLITHQNLEHFVTFNFFHCLRDTDDDCMQSYNTSLASIYRLNYFIRIILEVAIK